MVKRSLKSKELLGFLIGMGIIICINIIGSYLFFRIDLTSENRYSISEPTKALLENLEDEIYITVYLEGNFPASFKRLRNETFEMLDEFQNYSKGKLEFSFINPSENPNIKERDRVYKNLYQKGLQPTDLEIKDEDGISKKVVWPGAIINYQEREVSVQLLKSQFGAPPEIVLNQSIESLEYELAAGIKRLVKPESNKIAFVEGHGELNKFATADAVRTLREFHEIDRISIIGNLNSLAERSLLDSNNARIENKYDLIIIAKPQNAFSEKDKFIIDQYLMYGGKIIWMLDAVEANMDSLKKANTILATPLSLNLEDQLFNYGVRINNDLIQDLRAAPIPVVSGQYGNQVRTELFPWLYFPLIISKNNHPINKNINIVKAEFASSIDIVGSSNLKKTVILSSSDKTKLVKAPTRVSLNMLRFEPDVTQFKKKNIPLAVLVEGEFNSLFENRLPLNIEDAGTIKFKVKSPETKQLFIGDGSLIENRYKEETNEYFAMGMDAYTKQVYGNKDFFLNAVNYLLNDSDLILAKSKSFKIRLLDKEQIQENKLLIQILNIGAPILSIILLGLILSIYRRKKYSN